MKNITVDKSTADTIDDALYAYSTSEVVSEQLLSEFDPDHLREMILDIMISRVHVYLESVPKPDRCPMKVAQAVAALAVADLKERFEGECYLGDPEREIGILVLTIAKNYETSRTLDEQGPRV